MLNRIKKYFSGTKSGAQSTDNSDVSAFLSFLIESPEAASFRDELLPRIENFQSKNASRQEEELPGLYLYVEKYIFKSSDPDLNRFRKIVGKHFKNFIEQHPDFKIIFLPYDQQVVELCKKFLITVSKRFEQFLGNSAETSWGALDRWLTQVNSDQQPEYETALAFTKVDFQNLGFPEYIRVSQDFFDDVEKRFNTGFVLTHYNEAYEALSLKFQNLDAFHELIKLFPNKTLDESKLNILSIQQIKQLLLEKVSNLEKISTELHRKNIQLEEKNEELNAQTELMNTQNKQLQEAQGTIELKNKELSEYSQNLEDVVERRTRELEKANKILTQYNQTLEDHAFAVSHHLKAPVARIMGLIQLLNSSSADVQLEEIMKMLDDSAAELNSILADQVRALNIKREASHMILESCNLSEMINLIVAEFKQAYHVEATMTVAFKGNEVIRADRKYLTEALRHILDNVFKFRNPERDLSINTQIDSLQDSTSITITDNGLGFPLESVKEKLFNPFQKFNTYAEGKGLGLYFTNQLISVLGGSISIKSSLNKGTEVTISLPVK